MIQDRKAYIEVLEAMSRKYRDQIAKGENWARVPCEITEQYLTLLRRDTVFAAEAVELVRRCDKHQMAGGGIQFFGMCNSIRAWCRDIYERELRDTI